jgi:membrane-associated protease RseP (regulator of RpoE activity)
MGIRAAWLVQLALGLAFWTGNALGLVDLHQLLGILLVLALWTQAALAYRAGVPVGMVAAAVVYGLIVLIVGLTQRELLPGSAHWVIEVIHLLLGIGLLGLAENLATRAKARLAPVA